MKKQTKKAKPKNKPEKKLKQIPFLKWEKIGQTVSGKLTKMMTGQFGGIIEIDKKININIAPVTLVNAVKQALQDETFKIGCKLSIKYSGSGKGRYGNKSKIFILTVDGKKYESFAGFKEADADDFLTALDKKQAENKSK